jgi:hypothetical protein
MSEHQRDTLALLLRLTVIAVFGGAFVVSLHTPGRAEEAFPWCVQGETLQCYYPTREHCELTVNYHASVSQIPLRCRKLFRRVSSAAMPDKSIGAENRNFA